MQEPQDGAIQKLDKNKFKDVDKTLSSRGSKKKKSKKKKSKKSKKKSR